MEHERRESAGDGALPPLRYAKGHGGLRRAVLRALRDEADNGARSSRAKALFASTSAVALLYGVAVSGRLEGAALVLCVAVLQPLYLVTALGVAHDASHGALSRRPWINRAGTFVFDLLGVNGTIWHFDHVVAHHRAPNVSRYDANLYVWGPIRMDPHAPLRPWHRYQHLYAPFIYMLASLFKVFLEDFLAFARTRDDAYLPKKHRASAYLRLVGFKLWALTFAFVLPAALSGAPLAVLAGYLAGHLATGLLMGAIFQPTHTNERVRWGVADADGRLPATFEENVLSSTADFAVDSPWITWLAGGLNIHAVHHLFPRLPQSELPRAAELVAEHAPRFGLTYVTFPTWRAALASHFSMLRLLGRPEASEAESPAGGSVALS